MTFMREKLRQFMIGRYGTDGLNQFLSIASIVMLLISLITRVSLPLSEPQHLQAHRREL